MLKITNFKHILFNAMPNFDHEKNMGKNDQ